MTAFRGRVAVITGAGGGIGKALALACAREGAHLALWDLDAASLSRVAAQVRSIGAEVATAQCDVSDNSGVEAAATAVYRRFGSCHLLFNNAGVLTGGPVWRTPAAAWRRCLEINVMGIVNALAAFVPRMIASEEPAHIVNTASAGGLVSVGGFGAYSASKHAVVSISETLAQDLRIASAEQVRVSVLCPGFVRTGIAGPTKDAELAANADGEAHRAAVRSACETASVSADEVAAQTLRAMSENRFYILTHKGTRAGVAARMDDILAGRPPRDPMQIEREESK